MKKVIDGALYNTDTAQKLGSWDNGRYGDDFERCGESLYKTKSGKYFLHGGGGPNSQYGAWHGNSGGWGEEIRPYTIKEASEWAQENLGGDEYAAIFGEPDEASDSKSPLLLSITATARQKLERMKSETGKTMSALVSEMIEKV